MQKRTTIPVITKYEFARLLAERAEEIANNKPVTIKDPGTDDPLEIAKLEYLAKRSPKKLKRIFPDGRVEIWAISELYIIE